MVVCAGVLLAGVGVHPGGWCPSGWCWCPSWWMVSFRLVLVSLLVDGGCLTAGGVSAASILQPGTHRRVNAKLLSAAGVSRVNRIFRAFLLDEISLIINYLDTPVGCAFT